jgi:hypothetical protein
MPYWAPTLATYAAYAIVAAGIYFGMRAMMNAAGGFSMDNGKMSMQRQPAGRRKIVYGGPQRMSGDIIYINTTNKQGNDKQAFLHIVLAVAGRTRMATDSQSAVTNMTHIYFNDDCVIANGGATYNPYSGKFSIITDIGSAHQTVNPTMADMINIDYVK